MSPKDIICKPKNEKSPLFVVRVCMKYFTLCSTYWGYWARKVRVAMFQKTFMIRLSQNKRHRWNNFEELMQIFVYRLLQRRVSISLRLLPQYPTSKLVCYRLSSYTICYRVPFIWKFHRLISMYELKLVESLVCILLTWVWSMRFQLRWVLNFRLLVEYMIFIILNLRMVLDNQELILSVISP